MPLIETQGVKYNFTDQSCSWLLPLRVIKLASLVPFTYPGPFPIGVDRLFSAHSHGWKQLAGILLFGLSLAADHKGLIKIV